MQRVASVARVLSLADLGALSGSSTSTPLPRLWASIRSTTNVTVIRPSHVEEQQTTFKPSPASLMCAGMSFSVSLFYPHVSLSSAVMTAALRHLVNEVPILAGRLARHTHRLVPRLSDHVIVLGGGARSGDREENDDHDEYDGNAGRNVNEHAIGFSFRTKTRENDTLRQAIESVWKDKEPRFLHERRPSAHTIEPIRVGKTEDDELAHVDLVHYKDGDVLTLHISHVLADAGRAIKLFERLSVIYEAMQSNKPVPPASITCDAWFEAAMTSLSNDPSTPANPPSPPPTVADVLDLRLSHIAQLPNAIRYYTSTKFVPVYVHVPRHVVTAMQTMATTPTRHGALPDSQHDEETSHASSQQLSKMDIVQALVVTLMRRARPGMTGPVNVIINMDLSRMHPPRDRNHAKRTKVSEKTPQEQLQSIDDTLGNSSDFLQVRSDSFHPTDVIHNARLIRSALANFRSNARENIRSTLQKTQTMSSLPKAAVHAAFILHGTREKLASCTSVASFSVDNIRFGGVSPAFHAVNSHVGFDWWGIITSVSGELTPDMDGWVVAMTVPQDAVFGKDTEDLEHFRHLTFL